MSDIERINKLLIDKENDIDCSEEESAFIKHWIKERLCLIGDLTMRHYLSKNDKYIMDSFERLFPIEYSESFDDYNPNEI